MIPQEIVDSVNEIPIKDAIECVAGLTFDHRGFAESPFRSGTDQFSQSFSISVSRNLFTDWKLRDQGYTGGPIKFYQLYKGVPFNVAVVQLGLMFGIIDEHQAKSFRVNLGGCKVVNHIKTTPRPALVLSEKKSPEELNEVYKAMIDLSPLSDEHYQYLIERGLTAEEISEAGFFTVPKRTIARSLAKAGFDLAGVPGFFKFNKEQENWNFNPVNGIGFPIRSINSLIQGIQVRTVTQEHQGRYFWLSSASADGVTKNRSNSIIGYYGCGPGTPVDFINGETDTLLITEGKFKEIAVRRYFPWATASVQGVGNWKGISDFIDKFNDFIVAFDADMLYNDLVVNQVIKLSDFIAAHGGNVKIAKWPEEAGKGIDDVLYAGKKSCIELLTMQDFAATQKGV